MRLWKCPECRREFSRSGSWPSFYSCLEQGFIVALEPRNLISKVILFVTGRLRHRPPYRRLVTSPEGYESAAERLYKLRK